MPPRIGARLTMGGRDYTLRYTAHALAKLEERRREPLSETLITAGRFSVTAAADLVWAGLLHEEPAPSVEQVLHRLEPPVKPILDAVMEALKPWIAQEEEAAETSEPG